LVLRSFDEAVTPDEAAMVQRALTSSAACRSLFVQLCQVHGLLNETLAPQSVAVRIKRRQKTAQRQPSQASPRRASSARTLCGSDQEDLAKGHAAAPSQGEVGADTLPIQLSAEDTVYTDPAKPGPTDPLPPGSPKQHA